MSKIGIISDIHGNIDTFKQVLQYFEQQNIRDIYFIGDAVGYLPYGIEVVALLKERKIRCIKGNHEDLLLQNQVADNEDVYQIEQIKNSIPKELLAFVKSWESQITFEANNKKYLLVHGSPNNNNQYLYPDTNLEEFANLEYDVIIMGHTHRPFIRKEYNKLFLNTGSLGLPRDIGNLAAFAVLDVETCKFDIFRFFFEPHQLIHNTHLHVKVVECLHRTQEHFVGELISITS